MPGKRTGKRVARRQHSASPAIEPDLTVGAVLVAALDGRWAKFLAQLRRNRRRCTEPSIHDLRVATRRMIATLDAVGAVLPGGSPLDVRRKLKRLLKGFNELRDLHIQLMHLQALRSKFPVVQPFLGALRLRERQLVREAAASIAAMKTRSMEQEIARVADTLAVVTAGPEAEQASRAALFGALAAAFVRAAGLRKRVAPGDPASIHALRVAFKKFRYTVEILAPLMPDWRRTQFRAMNAYQTRMGEIQDLGVVSQALMLKPPGRLRTMPASLLPVHQFVRQQRTDCIGRFMREADQLLTFSHFISWSPYGTLHPSPRHRRAPRDTRLRQR
jgi:CHAD domain-containing protein